MHLYSFGTCRNFIALLVLNGFSIRKLGHVLVIFCFLIILSPFRLIESLRYGRKVYQTIPRKDPIFIIGHWRSGTTWLHYLLSQDPQFGYLSAFESFFFPCALSIRKPGSLLNRAFRNLELDRGLDNLKISQKTPSEDEYSIASLSTCSHSHSILFQRKNYTDFPYLIVDDSDDSYSQKWQQVFKYVMKKMTALNPNRRLLLKNPHNTGKVKLLKKLYPDAKFIHIHRNPYEVYQSTINMGSQFKHFTLKIHPDFDGEKIALTVFERLMKSFLEARKKLPENDIVDVGYKELIKDPEGVLKHIYQTLKIDGFDNAYPHFISFIDAHKDYKTNNYNSLNQSKIHEINTRLGFLFDEFGYKKQDVR